ncbi:MAG: hypothetical protein JWM69_560, partial [Candidatus Binatus sp.]|nr:hypothetical protein [Candidatus Binatus sp.]
LALAAYGALELREFADLDLLVHREDVPQVAEILTGEGYRSPHTRREGLATAYFQEFEDSFTGPAGLGAVDLHWNMTPQSFRFAPDEESLWRRARTVDLDGAKILTLASEDLLLYLCVHGAKHGWVTLGNICDVAELVRACPIDLARVLHDASRLGSRRMLLAGLYLAKELVDGPVPETIVAIARADRDVRALALRVVRGLFSERNLERFQFDPWRVPIGSIEEGRTRARYVLHRLLAPTMGDFELVRLPRALFPLYWLIRPFRMAVQYTPRLIRGAARDRVRDTGINTR